MQITADVFDEATGHFRITLSEIPYMNPGKVII